MRPRDLAELFLLAAIWGASFLFMRVAAPALGPVPLMFLRVGIAAVCLAPLAATRARALRGRLWATALLGALNSALPFCLLAYATLHFTAGLAAILNATSPLWGALVAHVWLGDRLTRARVAGLALGFAGVVFLMWGRASFHAGGGGLAVAAAMGATLSYGVAASYAKRRFSGVDPLAVAAGTQVGASLLLALPAVLLWPAHPVPARIGWAVLTLGVVCTAFAYVLYFRLIASLGPARAIAVTFLIPPFAVLWGAAFLGEPLTARTVAGACIVLAGTALVTGLVKLPARPLSATPSAGSST
jgi:drug/metabolite transporter (DMT)-like permease